MLLSFHHICVCVSYPERLGVVQLGHQHQALGGKNLSRLDDGHHLVGLIHLAGLRLLQLRTRTQITAGITLGFRSTLQI